MTAIFKKLNYKNQERVVILDAPATFRGAMEEMEKYTKVSTDLKEDLMVNFVLVFVTERAMIQEHISKLYPLLEGDAVVWFSYPKASSRRYKANFNRDNGWEPLGEFKLEGVRQVAIDDDWSALRFRKMEFIKVLKRDKSRILSKGSN